MENSVKRPCKEPLKGFTIYDLRLFGVLGVIGALRALRVLRACALLILNSKFLINNAPISICYVSRATTRVARVCSAPATQHSVG